MANKENPLLKQLDESRFGHAIAYVKNAAMTAKKLNSGELAHLNGMITGSQEDPWRFNPAEVQLPSGKLQSFNMVSNPINRAREIAGHALDFIYNEKPIEGAAYAYAHLVLEHLFKSANRRTAVLAAVWVLSLGDFEVDADELLNVPLGDLREPGVKEQLKETIEKLIRKI